MSLGTTPPLAVFRVDGTPVTQGSMRHVGKGIVIHDKRAELTRWRTLVSLKAHEAYPRPPIDKPVQIRVDFYLPRPKSHYLKNGDVKPSAPKLPGTKPDLDKLVRAIGDAICQGPQRIITQDSRITTWHATKTYSRQPRAEISIWEDK